MTLFGELLQNALKPLALGMRVPDELLEIKNMLALRVEAWKQEWLQEGRQEGRQEGQAIGEQRQAIWPAGGGGGLAAALARAPIWGFAGVGFTTISGRRDNRAGGLGAACAGRPGSLDDIFA
jgi:hypothetical protein